MELNDLTLKVWNKAKGCNCDKQDCQQNHKLCAICEETIIYNAHESNQPTNNLKREKDYLWKQPV